MPPLILVTGATGYIASLLIPQLLERGYRVRAMARQPERLKKRKWYPQVDMVRGDVQDPASLLTALKDVHTAYYLIHNMSLGHGYTEIEVEGARNFASAAEQTGVEHIIYLGGLADPEQHIAPHMRSRIETGVTLRKGKVPVTEFRAGVIAGSGSISFEMIRFMTELFPIVPGPLWMKNKSQPIAVQNIIDYLMTALENKNGQGQVFEIGGPDILTYKESMLRYARLRGLRRSMVMLPGLPVWFMALGVDMMTPVPYPIAQALIGGLSADSVVKHHEALQVFPEVKLIDFDSAAEDALKRTHPNYIERVWDGNQRVEDPLEALDIWLKHEGCFIAHCTLKAASTPETLIQKIEETTRQQGWTVEEQKRFHILTRQDEQKYGKLWVEWRVEPDPVHLTQTVFFSPHGLPGFLYWLLFRPFHQMKFRRLLRKIVRKT